MCNSFRGASSREGRQKAVYKIKCFDCQTTYLVNAAETLARD